MRERITADIFIFCLFLWAPWQWTAVAAVIFMIYFPNYWEGAALALAADSLYSLPEDSWTAGFGFFTLSALFILYAVYLLKSKVKVFN